MRSRKTPEQPPSTQTTDFKPRWRYVTIGGVVMAGVFWSAGNLISWDTPTVELTYPDVQPGFTLELEDTYVDDTHRIITASTNKDIEPTPYYIEIFNQTTGQEILRCDKGTECQATIPPYNNPPTTYIAYVAMFAAHLPPREIQATSRELMVGPHPA